MQKSRNEWRPLRVALSADDDSLIASVWLGWAWAGGERPLRGTPPSTCAGADSWASHGRTRRSWSLAPRSPGRHRSPGSGDSPIHPPPRWPSPCTSWPGAGGRRSAGSGHRQTFGGSPGRSGRCDGSGTPASGDTRRSDPTRSVTSCPCCRWKLAGSAAAPWSLCPPASWMDQQDELGFKFIFVLCFFVLCSWRVTSTRVEVGIRQVSGRATWLAAARFLFRIPIPFPFPSLIALAATWQDDRCRSIQVTPRPAVQKKPACQTTSLFFFWLLRSLIIDHK